MGGIFGEGIDLKNEQLIGAIVVGTGLPQISNEREILMGYYDKTSLDAGFDYAYRYPGMNKVLQAAGRVIRTVEDVGVIELLDERFLQSEYRALFPREWERQTVCRMRYGGKVFRRILEPFLSLCQIVGSSFKNSSVDCETGSVGLMAATICLDWQFFLWFLR